MLDRLTESRIWSSDQVPKIRQDPVWLPPRQMPQMAPLLARRLLSISHSDKIVSTLDPSLQRELESLALNVKNQLPPRTSLAMLVVDHTSMAVRGYVGSADFTHDSRFGHVDMIASGRSPGSGVKPFIYGMGLGEGLIQA